MCDNTHTKNYKTGHQNVHCVFDVIFRWIMSDFFKFILYNNICQIFYNGYLSLMKQTKRLFLM